jgi:hypothetical protein
LDVVTRAAEVDRLGDGPNFETAAVIYSAAALGASGAIRAQRSFPNEGGAIVQHESEERLLTDA